MRLDLEEIFVDNFVNANYRDRVLFELKSSKKREDALMRFSHNVDGLIRRERVFLRLKKFDESELKSFLKEQNYYVVSFKYINGIMMNVNEVLDYLDDEYLPVIVCGTNMAVVKKEFESGYDNFYLLKKQEKSC